MTAKHPLPQPTDFDYAIFFRLAHQIEVEKLFHKSPTQEKALKDLIRRVKDSTVPDFFRDFYIAFEEPIFCFSGKDGYTPGFSRYRMDLHNADSDYIDPRIRQYSPTHFLSLDRIGADADLKNVTGLAIRLEDCLGPSGNICRVLDDIGMYFKDTDRVMPVS